MLGATGKIGRLLFLGLSSTKGYEVWGTSRSSIKTKQIFNAKEREHILDELNAWNIKKFENIIYQLRPQEVINCIGIIKQLPECQVPEQAIYVNALFPHLLSGICKKNNARLIHLSTDCVFSGRKGNYDDNDTPDALDMYGKTKGLGEVANSHSLTIRSSYIGHELGTKYELLEWFLSQRVTVKGFRRAIYSGLTLIELTKVFSKYIIPNDELTGIYNISSKPISKFDLLQLIAKRYNKSTRIEIDDNFICDRSLNSDKFRKLSKYIPPDWPKMIEDMYVQNINLLKKKSISA